MVYNRPRKTLVLITAAIFLAGAATSTELQNIEKITPQGNQNIDITGKIDLKGNSITDTSGTLVLDGGNVDVPSGNLEVSGNTDGIDLDNPGTAITVNSNQYEITDNSVSVTELDTGSTDSRYLNRDGDAMTGNLNMDNNKISSVSQLDISTSSERIASFSNTGIDFNQPLSIESPGPLSISNGIELTGTSTNTIESYSTMYLSTSSGSPSDIVLTPTGQVGIDSGLQTSGNASIGGNIDMTGGQIKNLQNPDDAQDAATRSYVNSNDNTIADNQNLAGVLNEGNTADSNINLGGNDLTNVGDRGSGIRIGGSTNVHGISDSNFYGIDIKRDSDHAYFGLRNYGDDRDDVVINNEQTGDNIRIQSDGNDRLVIRGGGEIDVSTGNLDLNGNSITSAEIVGNQIDDDTIDNSEIQNSDKFTFGGGKYTGDLNVGSNNINNIGTSNVDMVYDGGDDRVEVRSNGNEDICIGNCGT